MTPEECARFILSDCQDPELKAKAARENAEMFAEAMNDPEQKAQWDAGIRAFSDAIDQRIAAKIFADIYGKL